MTEKLAVIAELALAFLSGVFVHPHLLRIIAE